MQISRLCLVLSLSILLLASTQELADDLSNIRPWAPRAAAARLRGMT